MPLHGAQELKAKIAEFRRVAPGALAASLYEEGLAVMPKAIRDCPWEFKFLRNSAFVTLPDPNSRPMKAALGFSRWYGLFVEERDDLHHPHGKAHFLRDAFTARIPGMLQRIASRTRKHIANGESVPQAGNLPTTPPDSGHPGDERDEMEKLKRAKKGRGKGKK